jgi:hypothetical protein
VGHGENLPGVNTAGAVVGQTILLSNRFVCQAIEPTVLTEGVDFVVLNLMSDYPGMRRDIGPIERTIFSFPQTSPVQPWTPRYGTPSTVVARVIIRPERRILVRSDAERRQHLFLPTHGLSRECEMAVLPWLAAASIAMQDFSPVYTRSPPTSGRATTSPM